VIITKSSDDLTIIYSSKIPPTLPIPIGIPPEGKEQLPKLFLLGKNGERGK